MNTKQIGQIAEQSAITELVKLGAIVSIPVGDYARYDLLVDFRGKLYKAQVKTGRLRDGTIVFSKQSIRSNTTETFVQQYDEQIDLFICYCPETDKCYYMPVGTGGSTKGFLRVDDADANLDRVYWAKDFELTNFGDDLESTRW